jgi:IclR family acetate operon transcriptional repressor
LSVAGDGGYTIWMSFVTSKPVPIVVALLWAVAAPRATLADQPESPRNFAEKIAPFLQAHCVGCHSGEDAEGGIELDRYRDSANIQTDYERWEKIIRLINEHQMPPSSTHRLLFTLQKHGFVEFDETTQEWQVGIEAFRIGNTYLARTNLVEAARKTLRGLMEDTGETANRGIAAQGDVVFIDQIETHNPIRAFFRPGTRSHMHASGIGKSLLADMPRRDVEKILGLKGQPEFTSKTLTSTKELFTNLEETRKRGWSIDDEERYSGMRCVASNIYNTFGETVAGISVSGPTVRFPDEVIARLGPIVKRAAAEVTNAIGGKVPSK